MKTTLNIDDTVMAQLKREAARQKRTMSDLGGDSVCAICSSASGSPLRFLLFRPLRAAARSSTSGTGTRSIRLWKADERVVVVDTNILVYAADANLTGMQSRGAGSQSDGADRTPGM